MDTESHLHSSRFDRPYRFECQKCGKCCARSDTIVNLTFPDLIRFQQEGQFTYQKLFDAIGFYYSKEDLTPEQIKKMVIPPIETQKGPAFLGLKKNEKGECIFLNSKNLCKIYSVRPILCRTFPFYFDAKPIAEPKPHMDISMQYAMKAIEYCPGIGEPYDKIDANKWLSIGKKAVIDLLQEKILIDNWNKVVTEQKIDHTAENYLKLIYEQLYMSKNTSTTSITSENHPLHAKYRNNILTQKQTKKNTPSLPK